VRAAGFDLAPQSASKTRVNALVPGRGSAPTARRLSSSIEKKSSYAATGITSGAFHAS
jgi:hypothetical protein